MKEKRAATQRAGQQCHHREFDPEPSGNREPICLYARTWNFFQKSFF
jgi:hypothetical protein